MKPHSGWRIKIWARDSSPHLFGQPNFGKNKKNGGNNKKKKERKMPSITAHTCLRLAWRCEEFRRIRSALGSIQQNLCNGDFMNSDTHTRERRRVAKFRRTERMQEKGSAGRPVALSDGSAWTARDSFARLDLDFGG